MSIILDADQLNTVDILHRYPECLKDYKRFSSLMSDCLSNNIVLKRVVCSAYEEGVLDSLRDSDNPQNTLAFCFKRLVDKCGMKEEYAKWVLVVFASYFGYTDELAATGLLSTENIYFKVYDECVESANSKICYTERNNGIEITNIILMVLHLLRQLVILQLRLVH